jgi:hypothetical protein
MRVGLAVAAALAAAVARGEEPRSAADPRLYAEPRADESPTPFACTVETLAAGSSCVFESAAPRAADPARQAVENAATAAKLADRLCPGASRHPDDPIPDPDVLAACKRSFAEKAMACGADGTRAVLDADGRFGGEFRTCYAALSGVLSRALTTARAAAPCCRCLVSEKCAPSADRCTGDALSRLLDGAAARCAEERCRDACRTYVAYPERPPGPPVDVAAPPPGPDIWRDRPDAPDRAIRELIRRGDGEEAR